MLSPIAHQSGRFDMDVIQKSPLFHSPGRCADLAMLEPITRAAVDAILADAKAAGTPLLVFETYRSPARQAALYAQGATQLRTLGVHGYGLACDLVKDLGGDPSWTGDFSFLAALAKKHGLIWGGDWGEPDKPHSFRDADHVQRVRVTDQQRLFSGAWFPEPTYNPWGPTI